MLETLRVCQAFSIRYKIIAYNLLKVEVSVNLKLTSEDTAQACVKLFTFIIQANIKVTVFLG